MKFQCSSASRKFLNLRTSVASRRSSIPFQCSSASRKFLNYQYVYYPKQQDFEFQCSSASRKFLNPKQRRRGCGNTASFSALQRAENSSIRRPTRRSGAPHHGFSALQRAENSSIGNAIFRSLASRNVSVLFSEPKIPQFTSMMRLITSHAVSVLFSEPKIPQSCRSRSRAGGAGTGFSALQRAENSSIGLSSGRSTTRMRFQCSSASRKFLNRAYPYLHFHSLIRFSALQRAENSSIPRPLRTREKRPNRFSALQRAENSSIRTGGFDEARTGKEFQCSSASRKFLNSSSRLP